LVSVYLLSLVSSHILFLSFCFFLCLPLHHPHLHSFPTRRSSDLRHRLLPPPGQEDSVLVDHLLLPQHLPGQSREVEVGALHRLGDRKSTRLSSSHVSISYAVFCLKKKRTHQENKHNAK